MSLLKELFDICMPAPKALPSVEQSSAADRVIRRRLIAEYCTNHPAVNPEDMPQCLKTDPAAQITIPEEPSSGLEPKKD